MNIQIETARLILRKWHTSDIETLVKLAKQEHIEYWMPDWRDYDKHAKGWIEMVHRHYEINDPIENFISWAVTLKETGRLIGFIGIGGFDELDEKEMSVAYWMDTEHTGRGYMTEAVKNVTKIVFDEYGYDHIIATVQPDNYPSSRVVEKAGFQNIRTIEFKDSGQTEVLPFCYYRLDNSCLIQKKQI